MIRNDFVSNSSSASFIILGYKSNYDEILDKIKEKNKDFKEIDVDNTCENAMKLYNMHSIDYKYDVSTNPYDIYFGYENNSNSTKIEILNEVKKMFPDADINDIKEYHSGEYN